MASANVWSLNNATLDWRYFGGPNLWKLKSNWRNNRSGSEAQSRHDFCRWFCWCIYICVDNLAIVCSRPDRSFVVVGCKSEKSMCVRVCHVSCRIHSLALLCHHCFSLTILCLLPPSTVNTVLENKLSDPVGFEMTTAHFPRPSQITETIFEIHAEISSNMSEVSVDVVGHDRDKIGLPPRYDGNTFPGAFPNWEIRTML